jgi:ferritin-like metal-binding protein YciE
MAMNALYDLYVKELKDAYSAEKQLVDALPSLAQAAKTPELRQAFEAHLEETKRHHEAVRQILDELDENPTSTVCKGMEGIIEEGKEVANEGNPSNARDAALIVSAQKAEHYEIASYGALRAYANELGYDSAATMLNDILDEEYDADQNLDDLAEGGILSEGLNEKAAR